MADPDYRKKSKGIFRDRTKDYDVLKGTITKTVRNKEGENLKKTTRYVDSDKLENKVKKMKARDAFLKEGNDPFESHSSFAKKGGSVIKGSTLRRQSSTSGLRTSKKTK
jgi:hypothetical protein